MTDTIGGTQIPLVASAKGEVVTDPLVQVLLLFLKAYLQDDANATAAWDTVGVAPGQKVVTKTFSYDPRKAGLPFNEKDLPALYLWRGNSVDDWEGEDRQVEVTQLHLFWVMAPDVQEKLAARVNFINGLRKAITNALEHGRTPSFKVVGDPDYQAGAYGSAYGGFTGAERLWIDSSRPTTFAVDGIPVPGDRPPPPRIYQGLEMLLTARELRVRGTPAPRYQLLASPGAFDVTLTINGGPSQVEGRSP